MTKVASLSVSQLHATCDPERIPWADSTQIPLGRSDAAHKLHFQPRVIKALDLALSITANGYNVYVSGDSGLGRTHTVLSYLQPVAKRGPIPNDLIYVYNFQDPDHPMLFSLPNGTGVKVKNLLRDTVQAVIKKLAVRFDNTTYLKKHASQLSRFQKIKIDLLQKTNDVAHERGLHFDMDDNGALSLSPMVDGKKMSDAEYEKLDSAVRMELKQKSDALVLDIADLMRSLTQAEETYRADEKNLDQLLMKELLDSTFSPVVNKILKLTKADVLKGYLADLREDIIKNTEVLIAKDGQSQTMDPARLSPQEELLNHYAVNVFVDHTKTEGAPIVVESHPTAANLLGCVERESELGALITNFTLIRAGSLQRANGGFLLLYIDDLLQYPMAWEGLMRALRSNQICIEDVDDTSESTIKTKGITPEPLALKVKVILIGTEDVYEQLLESDDRFAKLFRIKAHLAEVAERNAKNIKRYVFEIANIIKEDGLLPFDRNALAWLVDHGCHLSEDQKFLSLRFPLLRELMIESEAYARQKHLKMVSSAILEEAYGAKAYRDNLVEEVYLEEYDREMIKVQTKGEAIGQVNGLSVTNYGEFEFGLPHRISCIVGVGQEGIIDLEREAELGGPIHTKAMMILESFLINHFAKKKPLVFSGSLYFEQNYAGIEGDSASGAELVALLSALGEVPVRLDLAITGAVSHTGQILPVGGVSRKIEGFFKVCSHHCGLTGTQGVIIPANNVDHLMLSPNVLEAVEQKKFFIYPVKTIEEAILLLTGLPAGRSLKNGGYTKDSLYFLVDQRLQRLGEYAQNAFRRTSKKKGGSVS